MPDVIKQLAFETLKIYAILIGIYFVLGLVLSRINATRPKIQQKECPSAIVKRDMIQSALSLMSISFFVAAGTVLQARGFGFSAPAPGPFGTVLTFIASMLIFDTWFYWGHRLIHTKRLFKAVHKWHHVSNTPTVWSNNSDSFLDNCFLQSYFLVAHFIFPIHSYVVLAHKIFDQITGMIGHSGHEYSSEKSAVYPCPLIAVTFHDQHHSHFKYNFATHFSVWDRLMGTLAPDYESRVRELTK